MKEAAEIDVELKNELGLHLRPAALFAQLAQKFDCEVFVRKGGRVFDGKSLWELLELGGYLLEERHVTISCQGADAPQALAALVLLVEENFRLGEPREPNGPGASPQPVDRAFAGDAPKDQRGG